MLARLVSLLVLVLGACAAPAIKPAPSQDKGAFELLGRVAVTSAEQKFSGNVRWMHEPEQDEVWFLTPLGQGVAHLVKDSAGVTLKTHDETHRAQDVESLTRQVLGWGLPLTGLESWVRGFAVPGVPAAVARDQAGRLARVKQGGWEISYLRYGDDGLPGKLRVSGEGLEIILVIDNWLLPASLPASSLRNNDPLVAFSSKQGEG
jgi:outer membrane lipoprotein LolB